MNRLKSELEKFWKWASMNHLEYSEMEDKGEWETDYPYWNDIYKSVKHEIERCKADNISIDIVQDILVSMAIDNECENILSILEEYEDLASMIIKVGANHYQHHARWQVVELIKRLGDRDNIPTLVMMVYSDKDKYVQRRALLALYELDKEEAKRCAKTKLNDEDHYLQKVSHDILNLDY